MRSLRLLLVLAFAFIGVLVDQASPARATPSVTYAGSIYDAPAGLVGKGLLHG